jgi:4-carboxymuconolactone decarboxylase
VAFQLASDYGYDQTLHGFDKSAGKLGVDRIDLLILHQALPARFDLTQEAYRALETLLADGRVRAIGVSNFMPAELTALDALDTGVRGGPEPDDVTLEATVDPSPKPDLTTRDRRRSRENRNPAMEEEQTPAQRLLGDFAPKMVQLTDDVLFGDVWKRPGLSPRDRSLVTVAVLAATYRPDQLTSHLRRALANGLTQDELVEALTHLAFYAGWPSGMAALTQLKTITADTGSGASR